MNWWGSMVPISEKDEVIKQYEVGMTAHFATSGFRLASAFTRDRQLDLLATMRGIESGILPLNLSPSGPLQLDPLLGQPLDPTHYTWEALFEQFGVLKLILLKINPGHVNLAAMDRFLSGNDELRRLLTDALSS